MSRKSFAWFPGWLILVAVCLAGCWRTTPNLSVQDKRESPAGAVGGPGGVSGVAQNIAQSVQDAKIVTGEPATTADDPKGTNVEPAKDRTGAVAVKMNY